MPDGVRLEASIRKAGPSIIGLVRRQICRALMTVFLLPADMTAPAGAQEGPEWTVVTVARNGSFGVGTASTQGQAIAVALRKCQAMSAEQTDCGAEAVAFRTGWALALLCGDNRVIVAERNLEDAEKAALDRIAELRQLYAKDLPPCLRLLTINPDGVLTTFKPKQRQGEDARRQPTER